MLVEWLLVSVGVVVGVVAGEKKKPWTQPYPPGVWVLGWGVRGVARCAVFQRGAAGVSAVVAAVVGAVVLKVSGF